MAYSKSNPPALRDQQVGGKIPRHWTYVSTDTAAVVAANGYFTNAKQLGFKVGDVVQVIQTGVTPNVSTSCMVLAINANGSADLSDGTALNTTNTN